MKERYGVVVGKAVETNSNSYMLKVRWSDKPADLEWIPVSGLEYSHTTIGVEVEAWREEDHG